MCGIVGVLGKHEAAPLLVEALKRLEYRGYDSAGIATVKDGQLDRRRAVGKLVNLSDLLVHEPLTGKAGIGHTRWATHGAATVTNAHPHRAGRVAVVHNGIIENFRSLRADLSNAGHNWETDTDTEVVALLCQSALDAGASPEDAVRRTLTRLEGAFALVFLFQDDPDLMIAARRGPPLAVGLGDGEVYVGSDAIAIGPLTDRIAYLEEGDMAVARRGHVTFFDATGAEAIRQIKSVAIDSTQVEKGGYKHFMAKEIADQPVAVGDTLNRYLDTATGAIGFSPAIDFTRASSVTMVACGTAFYACLTAKYWFETLARLPVEVDVASEFRYREPPLSDHTVALFVSQSGETADTLAALRYCRKIGLPVASLTNVVESSIARESQIPLHISAGTEIGVASTKAFTCQLATLALLAIDAGQQRGTLDAATAARHIDALMALPGLINTALGVSSKAADIARRLADAQDVLFLGRGAMYPLALEGALKLKEISYIHAEGYASGELKHGPIALVDRHVPVVVLAPRDRLFDKTVSNMQEVMAREGRVLLITDSDGAGAASDGVWQTLRMPTVDPLFAPILYAIPAQLLAYHTAVAKGTDVDQPRNLAKSVTVE